MKKVTRAELSEVIDSLLFIKDYYLENQQDKDNIERACEILEYNDEFLTSDYWEE